MILSMIICMMCDSPEKRSFDPNSLCCEKDPLPEIKSSCKIPFISDSYLFSSAFFNSLKSHRNTEAGCNNVSG